MKRTPTSTALASPDDGLFGTVLVFHRLQGHWLALKLIAVMLALLTVTDRLAGENVVPLLVGVTA
jgi:hypothetical protein